MGPTVAYVDDVYSQQWELKAAFSSLQSVLADITHMMRRILDTLSAGHSKRAEFGRKLSDTFFQYVPGDREALERWHREQRAAGNPSALSQEELNAKPNKYWARRCRRMVHQREVLVLQLNQLLADFAPASGQGLDADGRQLLTADTKDVVGAIIKLVEEGHVCDPEGFTMYIIPVQAPNGQPTYICIRGTNQLEG